MSVIISGASGLIGTALASALRDRGTRVTRLVRREARSADEISWDPAAGRLDADAIRGAAAIVSLGGASVGRLPWTRTYRETLVRSRVEGTRTIVNALHALAKNGEPVPALLSASASGFYGSAPGVELTEKSPVGDTFLARLCETWEAEALRAEDVASVALLRTSPILHPRGVLRPMIQLTRFGLGGPLGSGRQVWPWISLEDEVRAILHVIDSRIAGPVNLAGPVAATNAEIGRALARKMRRPFFLPAPTPVLKLALGTDATESLLTADARVTPSVLAQTGFAFTHDTAEAAIRDLDL
ncbi:TIGR01777 family oxidoreductase [Leucobacter sp. CSA2]|uniref:TIGR01777 family oxidoreductase n=1 Tax=Leucobacter edaphi TaxID=2796472 RepID=A0A934QDI7_9MICO|nr:TIGR01777 family oxidoreductase [Leucobacter edaphi]MBK0422624.1 TIGR01777 family oxidoreductase [Leucobacter edaphi]